VKNPEMDFSFFGEEAIEEVKRFTTQVVEEIAIEASTALDQSGAVIPVENIESQPAKEITHSLLGLLITLFFSFFSL